MVKLFEDPKFDNGTENEKQALKTQVQDLMNEVCDEIAMEFVLISFKDAR